MNKPSRHKNSYCGVRVAVLGASGFIGRWVAHALWARGASVALIVRNRTSAGEIFAKYGTQGDIFVVDLQDKEAVRLLFRHIRPAITFNLAGYGIKRWEREEQTAYQVNAHLVNTICESLAETRDPNWHGQDIVHVGSALEYGSIGGDLSEDSIPNPTTLYGRSKLAGTVALKNACQANKIKGLTARLFTVYGPGEAPGRLLPSLMQAAKTKEALPLTAGKQARDFTYVEDIAKFLLRLGLTSAEPGEIVNLATGYLTTVRRFVETAAEILHIPSDRLQFGAIPTRVEEMDHDELTLSRLRKLIGVVPETSIADGIHRTIDFENLHIVEAQG